MPEVQITRASLRTAMGSKPRKRRSRRLLKDVFKRQYTVWVDLTGEDEHPTGLIDRNYTAPVNIPDRYLTIDADRPWRMVVDFVAWVRDLKQARAQWETIVKFWMKKLYGAKGVGVTPTQEALELAGEPPMDFRLAQLTAAGDPWCLGFTSERTPAVRAVIGEGDVVPVAKARRTLSAHAELRLDPELQKLLGARASDAEFEDEAGDDEVEALDFRRRTDAEDADEEEEDNELTGDADEEEEDGLGAGLLEGEDDDDLDVEGIVASDPELAALEAEEVEERAALKARGKGARKMRRQDPGGEE